MHHEMTSEERKEVALEDFMRELVDTIAKRFDEQKTSITFLKSVADDMKDEITSLHEEITELRREIVSINEGIVKLTEKQNKISRDILGAIID